MEALGWRRNGLRLGKQQARRSLGMRPTLFIYSDDFVFFDTFAIGWM